MDQTQIDAITSAVDFGLISGAVATIFAAVVGLYLAVNGGKKLVGLVRGV